MKLQWLFFISIFRCVFAELDCGNSLFIPLREIYDIYGIERLDQFIRENCTDVTDYSPVGEFDATKTIDQPLYGVVDIESKQVIGVSMNYSSLALRHNLEQSNGTSKRSSGLMITPLTVENIGNYSMSPQQEATKRSWSDAVQTALIAYVAGGTALRLTFECTNSNVVRRVYNMYITLGRTPVSFFIRFCQWASKSCLLVEKYYERARLFFEQRNFVPYNARYDRRWQLSEERNTVR